MFEKVADFIKETFEHTKKTNYIQIGLFVLVVLIIFVIEHLTHYNNLVYGMVANPFAGTGASTQQSSNNQSNNTGMVSPSGEKKKRKSYSKLLN